MKWIASPEWLTPRHFAIEYAPPADPYPSVGYYLYVYEGNRCTYDYLQDTFQQAVECAFEEFGVPKEAWIKTAS